MSEKAIRMRFAPSPTGFLHIGNLRTALFGYLLCRHWNGTFILRVEDTDQKREVEGAVEALLNVTNWIGIDFDEGPHLGGTFGPYIQSQRLDIYKRYAQELIDKGEAYYCFCTEGRLEEMRQKQQENKEAPRYDRCCREISLDEAKKKIAAGETYVIRQKMPLSGEVKVYDELRGEISFPAHDLEDHVLIKSNGIPTYQFASVVDDHLMEISHVTRGEEWLPSYPKNILLYQAFDWTPPKFIHLPLILNKTGGKLSKRQGDVFVEDYRSKGYLKEAIINFCALLGWHSKDDQEIYTLEELKNKFELSGLGSSPAVFDLEKLDYLNGYYIRQKSVAELSESCRPYLESAGLLKDNNQNYLEGVISLIRERLKRLDESPLLSKLFFIEPEYETELLVWKKLSLEEVKNNLNNLKTELQAIESDKWSKENLEARLVSWLKESERGIGDYLWPFRVALSGEKNSPGPFEIAGVLGKEKTLKRVETAIQKI